MRLCIQIEMTLYGGNMKFGIITILTVSVAGPSLFKQGYQGNTTCVTGLTVNYGKSMD